MSDLQKGRRRGRLRPRLWWKQVPTAAAIDKRQNQDTIAKNKGQRSGCVSSKWAGWPDGYKAFKIVKPST